MTVNARRKDVRVDMGGVLLNRNYQKHPKQRTYVLGAILDSQINGTVEAKVGVA